MDTSGIWLCKIAQKLHKPKRYGRKHIGTDTAVLFRTIRDVPDFRGRIRTNRTELKQTVYRHTFGQQPDGRRYRRLRRGCQPGVKPHTNAILRLLIERSGAFSFLL